jgi:hypothetical protein
MRYSKAVMVTDMATDMDMDTGTGMGTDMRNTIIIITSMMKRKMHS